MRSFEVRGGGDHLEAWLDSIRAGKPKSENLSILNGHLSAGLAHLANISYRMGRTMKPDEIRERLQGNPAALETLADFEANLLSNGIDWKTDEAVAGPWLDFDPVAERFTGEFAEEANKLLTEEYREEFKLPEV
jgi:hypothetical protein